MSNVSDIFGSSGEIYRSLIDRIAKVVIGSRYEFTDLAYFDRLPIREQASTYWTEILFRSHWAASSNLLRHRSWLNACLSAFELAPNFVAFCAVLRGLTEGAADAAYSLGPVPLTLAENYRSIACALSGRSDSIVISTTLENTLIHFQFARKLAKHENAPEQHEAEPPWKYIARVEPPEGSIVGALYAQLCQVVHPASDSLNWATYQTYQETGRVVISSGNDREQILTLCKAHRDAIEHLQMQSINTSILLLQVLNRFDLKRVRTKVVDEIHMNSVPLWHKIDKAFKSRH
ncbi:MAG: hypothetical protein WAV22_14265 [Porticoccaceae bacterium]